MWAVGDPVRVQGERGKVRMECQDPKAQPQSEQGPCSKTPSSSLASFTQGIPAWGGGWEGWDPGLPAECWSRDFCSGTWKQRGAPNVTP